MADDRIRIPSARLAVSLLDDEDAITLMSRGKAGIYALWAFTGLLILAKTLKNKGRFRNPMSKYARRIGLTPKELTDALEQLTSASKENGHEAWIVNVGDCHVIRSWERWNPTSWGGNRDGAGRPKENNQDDNQLEINLKSRCQQDDGSPVPVPSSSPNPSPPEITAQNKIPPLPAHDDAAKGEEGSGDARVVWDGRDQDRSVRVFDVLTGDPIKMGVPWASTLADCPQCTVDMVLAHWNQIDRTKAINGASVLGTNLAKRLGVVLPARNEKIGGMMNLSQIIKNRNAKG